MQSSALWKGSGEMGEVEEGGARVRLKFFPSFESKNHTSRVEALAQLEVLLSF